MTLAATARAARPLRRKTFAILAASAAVAAGAALLTARGPAPARPSATASCETPMTDAGGGMRLAARAQHCQLLRGTGETHVAIELRAPSAVDGVRASAAMALVIDRSGSMLGEPMRDAKAAALRAIGALSADDWFSVVTYSTDAELMVPLGRATPEHKARARVAIERIVADGGTNISAGLARASTTLSGPCGGDCPRDFVGRIVLISDGQANEGIYDRDGLAALASRTAEGGTSITAVGVGLDFDELTMTAMAASGRGNYYFVEHAADLAGMFEQELGSLGQTVAIDARLEVTAAPGVELLDAYGYRVSRDGGAILVPIADLRAGDARKVVIRVRVTADHAGPMPLLGARLTWRPVGAAQPRSFVTQVAVAITDDPTAAASSRVAAAERHVQEAQLARALDEATAAYEQGDAARASQILDGRARAAQATAAELGDRELEKKVQAVRAEGLGNFAAPATRSDRGKRGTKANRGMAYDLAR